MNVNVSTNLVATALACMGLSEAVAHHAFITEFEPDLEGEVQGVVTEVMWANPHIRYGVNVVMSDGTTEEWFLQPPGNLPAYRLVNWAKDTVQVGDTVRATGNVARNGFKRLYATCIYLESGRRL
ncbi:MAG: DUF6152 family protein, partial [Gammaproteobacteria bacterium]